MAINPTGGMRPQSFTLPQRPKEAVQENPIPPMGELLAYAIGDDLRFNPAGKAVKVRKADDSAYWAALGYNA